MSDKRDCYFFSEEHDMGARIQTCLYSDVVFGKCECSGCTNFLSKTEADKIVRAAINKPRQVLGEIERAIKEQCGSDGKERTYK